MAHVDGLQQAWLHELAQEEIYPTVEGLQKTHSFDPQQLIEESTIEFLTVLRENLCEFCRLLNSYAEQGARFAELKVYTVTQSTADFMLFRNQIKLIFSNVAHGVIEVSATQHRQASWVIQAETDQKQNLSVKRQELLAQIGPFRDVFWTFQGEKITAWQVAKYYFIEFVKMSRNLQPVKLGHQMLLERIKTLLEEKGVQL